MPDVSGVPPYDVQALPGHEGCTTTQRYAHLAADAHGKVLESWNRRLGVPKSDGAAPRTGQYGQAHASAIASRSAYMRPQAWDSAARRPVD